jgi:hypothetical protein
MATTSYVSPDFFKKMQRYWQERMVTTGRPPSQEETQAAMEAALREAGLRSEEESKRVFSEGMQERQMSLAEQNAAANQANATISLGLQRQQINAMEPNPLNPVIGGIGAAGSLALGYGALAKQNMLPDWMPGAGAKTSITTPTGIGNIPSDEFSGGFTSQPIQETAGNYLDTSNMIASNEKWGTDALSTSGEGIGNIPADEFSGGFTSQLPEGGTSIFSEIPSGVLPGVASFGGHLLAGEDVGEAAFHGAGAAAGTMAGTAFIPIPVVGSIIGGIVGDIAGGFFEDVGSSIIKSLRGSCLIMSFFYGVRSKQVRYARVYCNRFLTIPTLIGYYTIAYRIIMYCQTRPIATALLRKFFVPRLFDYMLYCLGRKKSVSFITDKVAKWFLSLCRFEYKRANRHYVPGESAPCIYAALRNGGVL